MTTSHVFADGDLDYIANLNLVRNDIATNENELIASRNGGPSLDARLDAMDTTIAGKVTSGAPLAGALNFNNFKATNMANATAPGDGVNLQTAQALISGGGVPSNIQITALGIGSLVNFDLVIRNGSAVAGFSLAAAGDTVRRTASGLESIPLDWPTVYTSGAFAASARTCYGVDVGSVPATATLPASPATNDVCYFFNNGGSFHTNNLTLNGNGKMVEGDPTMDIDMDKAVVAVKYNGTQWRIA